MASTGNQKTSNDLLCSLHCSCLWKSCTRQQSGTQFLHLPDFGGIASIVTKVAKDVDVILVAVESQKSSPQTVMLVLRAKPDGIQYAAGIFLEISETRESHQHLLKSYRAQHDHEVVSTTFTLL